MNSIDERKIINKIQEANQIISELRLAEVFLHDYGVIEEAQKDRDMGYKHCTITIPIKTISSSSYDIPAKYHDTKYEYLPLYPLTMLISEYLDCKVEVYVREEKKTYQRNTGKRETRGMGLGEEDIYVEIQEYYKIVDISFSNESYTHLDLFPSFVEIPSFTERIVEEVYHQITHDLERKLPLITSSDFKYETLSILSTSNENYLASERKITVKLRIFSDVNDRIMEKLKDWLYKYKEERKTTMLGPEITSFSGLENRRPIRGATLEYRYTIIFTISEISRIERNFLLLTVKSTCEKDVHS